MLQAGDCHVCTEEKCHARYDYGKDWGEIKQWRCYAHEALDADRLDYIGGEMYCSNPSLHEELGAMAGACRAES